MAYCFGGRKVRVDGGARVSVNTTHFCRERPKPRRVSRTDCLVSVNKLEPFFAFYGDGMVAETCHVKLICWIKKTKK